jgi:ParB/RepB/Spo0J family partition protein
MTQNIRIELLDPHPDNPRLLLREDVIKTIRHQLRAYGEYDPMHAIIVRPIRERFQIIAGHHRVEAARREELAEIPAWVREMDDEEAFMQLVLSNAQSELAPLERGFHALAATESKFSIRDYAGKVQRSKSMVQVEVSAAKVALSSQLDKSQLLNRANQLAEIHAAPEHCQPALVERLVKDKWNVKVTAQKVKDVLAVKPPRGYDDVFTQDEVQLAVAQGLDVTEITVRGVRAIERARADIRDVQFQIDEYLLLFETWLSEHGGWDYKATAAEAERILDLQRNLRAEEAAKAAKLKRAITLPEWNAATSAEREAALAVVNPKAKLLKQSSDSIEWAQWSWNPVTGCEHNCPYCYARDLAERHYPQKFVPSLVPEALSAPMNMLPPKEAEKDLGLRNIFTCSMADLFGNWVPDQWIWRVLEIAAACPAWNFLMLTKFPQRLAEFDFPDNVWVGTSVDLQARVANAERALKKVRAKTKWVSIEPLIEPIEMDFSLVQWVVIGGASPSAATDGTPATPAWKPPRLWVADVTARAHRAGCEVYHKTNLNFERLRNYPGFTEGEPVEAPEVFRYLNKGGSGLVNVSIKKVS